MFSQYTKAAGLIEGCHRLSFRWDISFTGPAFFTSLYSLYGSMKMSGILLGIGW
jgi:hypothetical protein